ncbi:uncharacterized protein KY384_000419 [Bacidia gigantensis]|uniref:uncharacterized protein n=1 Tax=Bacidia gigantensis TaxID=2732470 RepID=UPI001D04ADFE|nr:uncharacterized protein KY384_000419 [Bacidia gigantensis]KAG8525659.1 hypothetical protein KY384_000419 [Bacidia gigantensis]
MDWISLRRLLLACVSLTWLVEFAIGASNRTKPLVVPPSQYWDGNDGPWSTFWTTVGTPGGSIRLLPSTSSNAIWPVLPEGCTKDDPVDCRQSRGEFFYQGNSSTYSDIGLYTLAMLAEEPLGYSANTSSGYDSVKLGLASDSSLVASHQVIEGVATKDFYLGALGLSPNAINTSSLGNSTPSLMADLKTQAIIPSLTWGYTAGASYAQPPAYGSLTLGGYDASRFVPNNVSFPFGPDLSRDLLVSVQRIQFSNQAVAGPLESGIYALLDSLVPDIWLPKDVCQTFEAAFGLTYNETANMYFVNDTLHQSLKSQNASVVFSLSPSAQSSGVAQTVSITLQYSSFDLQLKQPSLSNETRYFPLRRADNATQYTLGRTFFQEAYVIANYEYRNFSVAQAKFPDLDTEEDIVTLPSAESQSQDVKSSKLSAGAIAGIVIGMVVFLAILMLAVWLWRRARKAAILKAKNAEPDSTDYRKAELAGQGLVEAPSETIREKPVIELSSPDGQKYEMHGESPRYELYAGPDRPELRGNSPVGFWRDSNTVLGSGTDTPKSKSSNR